MLAPQVGLQIESQTKSETFKQAFGSGWRDDQRAAPSLLQADALVQPGHAESGSVNVGGSRAGGGQAVAGLAAVVLDLQDAQLLVGEVGADLAEVGHDNEPVGDGQEDHVGRLQQAGDAQCLKSIKCLKVRG